MFQPKFRNRSPRHEELKNDKKRNPHQKITIRVQMQVAAKEHPKEHDCPGNKDADGLVGKHAPVNSCSSFKCQEPRYGA